ncbi:hypothetical protein J6590_059974 [Homalodisca vitripennis]|nr:hypothetical protein J6590_059974 [Homalodisca vitripennis]
MFGVTSHGGQHLVFGPETGGRALYLPPGPGVIPYAKWPIRSAAAGTFGLLSHPKAANLISQGKQMVNLVKIVLAEPRTMVEIKQLGGTEHLAKLRNAT